MGKQDLQLSNELRLSMPQQQIDLFDMENLEQMTYAQLEEKKKMLSKLRQHITLQVDDMKLRQSIKTLNAMDMILDRMMDIGVDNDGKPVVPSAKDLQAYSSAVRNLSDIVRHLSRLDSLDGYGTANTINIRLEYAGK